ncbi:hypothetical protein A6I89_02005 [Prescottella equi]|uniref:Uncharacterized protein n=1 Tax=Rhodococcus phage REQ3 TaxID=1109714 RepID=G9FHA2_9CAUD|nr:hypothetical protein RoPhREQ3_gp55 [Rhodococcus phage REQ3]ORL29082.1 hypothetical protein A6I89_02005 [Prescottella equi]AEV51991.1 hypothetical protein [Rhodococcus phage REQ3]SUE04897.1 Uncharacterised protein [Prescottella equi]SUE07138.1 Uncharacterised protein [Prescottella equi]SUE19663.1 Uncharacterised protein [Prescottella equi]
MSGYQTALIGVAAPIVAALFTYLGTRVNRQSTKESNNTEAWAEILKANNEQNARLNAEIREVRTDQNELRGRVEDLERKLEHEQRVRRGAFDYIRILLRWIETHLPGVTPPAAPELLREEL